MGGDRRVAFPMWAREGLRTGFAVPQVDRDVDIEHETVVCALAAAFRGGTQRMGVTLAQMAWQRARNGERNEHAMKDDRLLTAAKRNAEEMEPSLRPQLLADFIGQEQVRSNLKVFI